MGNGCQQCGAQPIRLHGQLRAVDIGYQLNALDGKRRLIGERIEQPLLFRRQKWAITAVAIETDDADGGSARAERNVKALGSR